jgi:hypothetical protein
MSPDVQSPPWLALWPHIYEQLAVRPAASFPARLLAVEPGRPAHSVTLLGPAGPSVPKCSGSLILEPHALPVAAATIELVAGFNLTAAGRTAALTTEAARVLAPGGSLVLRERIVPGSGRRGRQARRQQAAGAYLNALARLRDGRHQGYLSQEQWLALLLEHGYRLVDQQVNAVPQTMADWLAGADLTPADALRLEVMLRQAPAEVADFLQIGQTDFQLRFHWPELLLIAVRRA